jgi:hypothetical protein
MKVASQRENIWAPSEFDWTMRDPKNWCWRHNNSSLIGQRPNLDADGQTVNTWREREFDQMSSIAEGPTMFTILLCGSEED